MKLQLMTVAAACVALTFVGCEKEKPLTGGKTSPGQLKTTGPIATFFTQNIANNTQSWIVDPLAGDVLTGAQGTIIEIPGGAFRYADNSVVTEPVRVTLVEIYNRFEMAMYNFPTEAANGMPLRTGGAFIVTYKGQASGSTVYDPSSQVKGKAPGANTGGIVSGMSMWDRTSSVFQARDNMWAAAVSTSVTSSGGNYDFFVRPGGCNIDDWWPGSGGGSGEFSTARVIPPSGGDFDDQNTELFVTFNGRTTSLSSLDFYDADGNFWTDEAKFIKKGSSGYFIALGWENGKMFLSTLEYTLDEENQEFEMPPMEERSPAYLQAFLDEIP